VIIELLKSLEMADVSDSYEWLILYDALFNVGYSVVSACNNMHEVLETPS
jgi:hypothetical protein